MKARRLQRQLARKQQKSKKRPAKLQLAKFVRRKNRAIRRAKPVRKLGRGPVIHDERNFQLGKYMAIPTPPASVDWYSAIAKWNPLGNLRIGNCTVVDVAHYIQAATMASKQKAAQVRYQAVIRAYSAVSGYNPSTGANDRGASLLAVMRRWRKVGVGIHKAKAFMAVDWTNANQVKAAIHLFGGIHVGLALPDATLNLFDTPEVVWDVNGPPNPANGHAVPILGYDANGNFRFPSWGAMYAMTTAFLQTYCEEAYVVWTPQDWIKDGQAPNGLNTAALEQDLAEL